MKRISVIVVAAGAVALMLTGCGGSEETSDASGLRKGNTDSSATITSRPTSTGALPTSADRAPSATTSSAPAATTPPEPTGLPARASDTTCAQFKGLDSTEEKAVIERILAENPDSQFTGSPNVALGTAKLVCLASSNASRTVAAAAGIAVRN
ncbi:hypothetical protein [Nocardia noduli]|uniref:hypothetical protein n=1 Tax=Nocardia noduli TaxID=2815722 RepID=UPI0020B2240B|nr:hypothetical protein [Nocardia noduli]